MSKFTEKRFIKMERKLEIIIEEIKSLKQLLPILESLKDNVESNSTDGNNAADTAYVLHEAAKELDEIRKEINRISELYQEKVNLLCTLFSKDNWKTENCTLTPDTVVSPKIPYKREGNEEKFDKLMKDMGITNEITLVFELVRPHYPGIEKYAAGYRATVGGLPFGLKEEDLLATKFKCRIRGKKKLF